MMDKNKKLIAIKNALAAVMRTPTARWLMLVGTGTSVAMNQELGMSALADHLNASLNGDDWKPISERLKSGDNLETALTNARISTELQNEIALKTFEFVSGKDAELRDDILLRKKQWVVTRLVKCLMRGLPPTNPVLPIVTPNYDMLIEYSCSIENIPYSTGYYGGILKSLNWDFARNEFSKIIQTVSGKKAVSQIKNIPHIELMKVHGSINLFRKNVGSLMENNLWINKKPKDFIPLIAPPGDLKTQETLNYSTQLFAEANKAFRHSTGFIVVGYGFNDEHIQKEIIQCVKDYNYPLIVLTRDPKKNLEELAELGDNVWIITGNDNNPDKTTRIRHKNKDFCEDFENTVLWNSDEFAKQILGG